MGLNDVWRTVSSEVGFFYEVNFESVPAAPGVYAWFYPLRLVSQETNALNQLVEEAQTLLSYNASSGTSEVADLELPLSWWTWYVTAIRKAKMLQLADKHKKTWDATRADNAKFEAFRKALLKSSILMPPLYVGKANNLQTRCAQHLGSSGFNHRFESFAKSNQFQVRTVRELIFVCIRTDPVSDDDAATHELLEELVKAICAPPYGVQ